MAGGIVGVAAKFACDDGGRGIVQLGEEFADVTGRGLGAGAGLGWVMRYSWALRFCRMASRASSFASSARFTSISSGRSALSTRARTSPPSIFTRPEETAATWVAPSGVRRRSSPGTTATTMLLWWAKMPISPSWTGMVRDRQGPS